MKQELSVLPSGLMESGTVEEWWTDGTSAVEEHWAIIVLATYCYCTTVQYCAILCDSSYQAGSCSIPVKHIHTVSVFTTKLPTVCISIHSYTPPAQIAIGYVTRAYETYTCEHAHMHFHTYVHTYVCKHTHTYIHTQSNTHYVMVNYVHVCTVRDLCI